MKSISRSRVAATRAGKTAVLRDRRWSFPATTDRMEASMAMVSIMRAGKDGGFDNLKPER